MVLGLDQNPGFEPIVALHDLLLQLASANRPQGGCTVWTIKRTQGAVVNLLGVFFSYSRYFQASD
jgi:hypothetical protein